ncbi:MAG: hypothetical protein HZA50_06165 [Planctomycetes bacterium]|nr:hypothetical protein [Planctomycetota bacterium]
MTVNRDSRLALGMVLGLFLACAAFGEDQILVKKDGIKITGEITKEGDNYKVKTRAGEVVVPAKDVDRIDPTPRGVYGKKAAELKPDSANVAQKRYELAQWAFEQGLFNEAMEQVKLLEQAQWGGEGSFYATVGPKLKEKIESAIGGRTPDNGGTPAATQGVGNTPKTGGEVVHDFTKELLTPEQISRIRLEELTKEDKDVRVEFKPNTLKGFMKKLAGRDGYDEKTFQKMNDFEKLWFMLDAFGGKDRDEVKDAVKINTDPKFMVEFRKIWPLIRSNCASANCHGGSGSDIKGGFYLYSGGGNIERELYTNFIILRGFNKGARMIDVQQPEKSLLLCYSLPRDKTDMKHPFANQKEINAGGATVSPIEKPFLCDSKDSVNYKKISEWMSSLQLLMRVDYNLDSWAPWGVEKRFFQLKVSVREILGETRPAGK